MSARFPETGTHMNSNEREQLLQPTVLLDHDHPSRLVAH